MGTGDATPAGNYEIASAALGLLTATYHDDNHFGPITMDYLTAIGSGATKVLRIATNSRKWCPDGKFSVTPGQAGFDS